MITSDKLIFVGHDSSDQGQLEIIQNNKIFFFTRESNECIGILNKTSLAVMARQTLKTVGESEMQ